jgi:hypothetical protein
VTGLNILRVILRAIFLRARRGSGPYFSFACLQAAANAAWNRCWRVMRANFGPSSRARLIAARSTWSSFWLIRLARRAQRAQIDPLVIGMCPFSFACCSDTSPNAPAKKPSADDFTVFLLEVG